jgi:hypothetical protein
MMVVSVSSFGVARGQDKAATADEYLKYVRPYFPGTWRIEAVESDGSAKTMGTMEVNIPKEVLAAGRYENVSYTHRNTVTAPDGTQKVSQWKATIVDRNTLVFEQVSGGSPLPPKSRFVRQSSAVSTK